MSEPAGRASQCPVETTTLECCPSCAAPVAAGDVFCESCGTTLDPAAAVAAPSPGDAGGTAEAADWPVPRPRARSAVG